MYTINSPIPTHLAPVILTKAGRPKRKLSPEDKLNYVGMGAPREMTLARVGDYRRLFAFRVWNGIATTPGKGPGAWKAYRDRLGDDEIVRHLLADRLPGQSPRWFGARSFETSFFFCLDVDADRCPKLVPSSMSRLPFTERCSLVERAFRRMGINPDNPYSVMIQKTPSGGRHYYAFFDAPYSLDQYHGVLHAVGLRHSPGEIEFFPSTKQGFRLPFGFLPGQPHDPHAWIQFIDDYMNGRIIRHTLADLHNHLAKHQCTQYQRIESRKKAAQQNTEGEQPKLIRGTPRRLQNETSVAYPEIDPKKEQRYQELLKRIHSAAEAEELLDLGILVSGTRHEALKHLAAHLIWFKNLSVTDAAAFLTEWAMNPRHVSKDIADDLANGTDKVAKQITYMCRWHEANKKTPDITPTDIVKEFSQQELEALRPTLTGLSPEDRINQASFLLHFLRFAKRHPAPGNDDTSWDAAPAIRQVVRRWPGCHHMKYKTRLSHAISAGCMKVVKGAWHRPNGPGRARTYRLSVPVVPESEWVMTYEAAFDFLMQVEPECSSSEPTNILPPTTEEETSHADHLDRPNHGHSTDSDRGALPSSLSASSPGASVDSGPRQCDPQPHATPGLHRRDPQELRSSPTVARHSLHDLIRSRKPYRRPWGNTATTNASSIHRNGCELQPSGFSTGPARDYHATFKKMTSKPSCPTDPPGETRTPEQISVALGENDAHIPPIAPTHRESVVNNWFQSQQALFAARFLTPPAGFG